MLEKENGIMLKKADLQAIKEIFRDEIETNNKRIEKRFNEHISKAIEDNNKRISEHFDKAIEDNNKRISEHFDKAIEDNNQRIYEHFEANNKHIYEHFDKAIEENNKKIFAAMAANNEKIYDKIESNTDLILDAVEGRIKETENNIQERLEKLETVYRIKNLEESNQSDMMKIILQLDKRVTKLETNRIA